MYVEVLNITGEVSYIFARTVVDGYGSDAFLWTLFCTVQLILGVILYQGARSGHILLLKISIGGLYLRLVLSVVLLLVILLTNAIDAWSKLLHGY